VRGRHAAVIQRLTAAAAAAVDAEHQQMALLPEQCVLYHQS